MVKMVLRDCITGRREAWKRMWNSGNNFLIPEIILLGRIEGGYHGTIQYNLLYWLEIFLLMFQILTSVMYPNRLSKPMFLVPLANKVKKKYLLTMFGLKVGIFSVIHIIVTGIRVWTECITMENGIIFFGVVTLLNIIMGLQNAGIDETSLNYKVTFGVCLFNCFFFMGIEGVWQWWECIFAAICCITQIILCVLFIKNEWAISMRKAMNYELVYVIKNKSKRSKI